MAWQRGQSKYGAKRITTDGRSFMSQGEASCYLHLKALEQSGEITNLKCQVTVRLTKAELRFVMDFTYEQNGETVWADYKGFETERWNVLKKLWPHYGPGRLVIYKGKAGRVFVAEEIRVEK